MAKFQLGDMAQVIDTPITVEVLEVGECEDWGRSYCPCAETIRFKDPESGEDDWAHADEFDRVSA